MAPPANRPREAGRFRTRQYEPIMLFTLQWYILREMGKTFMLAALGLTVVVGLGGGVMNLIEVEQVSPSQLLRMMLIVLPVAGTMTLPVAALYAATMTFGRLSADNELLACKSSGINIHRLLLAPLTISLLSAGCTFYFINFMAPGFVRELNRFVQTDIRQFVEQRVNSPERLSLPGGQVRIYAAGLEPSADDSNTVVLTGVAFLELDGETWKRYGLCESIAVRFDTQDGEPTIAASLNHPIYFDRQRNQLTEFKHQQIAPNKIPRRMRQRVKWLDLGELLRFRKTPQSWLKVGQAVAVLRSSINSERFYADVFERYRSSAGRISLHTLDGDVSMRAQSGTTDAYDGRLTFTDVTVTHSDGGRPTTTQGDFAALLVRQQDDGTQVAALEITGNVRVRQDSGGPAAVHKGRQRIQGIVLPDRIVEAVAGISDAVLLDPLVPIALHPAATEFRRRATEACGKFVREVTSELHSRMTLSLTVFVLVILGAALGIVSSGGHAFGVFGISFVPAVVVIVMNIMGRQLAENPQTANLGIATMWLAIAVVAFLDVWVLARVVRR